MWTLYCLPGRIIAQLGFLWPGRGQLWASKRRYESGFAHFIYATAFWAVAALLIAAHFSPSRPQVATAPIALGATVAHPAADSPTSTYEAAAERPAAGLTSSEPAHQQPADENKVVTSSAATPPNTSASIAETTPEPIASDEKVAAAIDRTFANGQPERWHSHGRSGYAVAGLPSADGCKLISIAIDDTPDTHLAPTKRCPQ